MLCMLCIFRAREEAKENEDFTEEERLLAFAKAKKTMSFMI